MRTVSIILNLVAVIAALRGDRRREAIDIYDRIDQEELGRDATRRKSY